ncbi:MAG: trigger factor [Christensenellales bacterium]
MKHRFNILIAVILILALAAGCANQPDKNITPGKTSNLTSEYNINDYVVLGGYKGIEVKTPIIEVTDEELQEEINNTLLMSATQEVVTNRPVQDGDTVNIDFAGAIDGVAYDEMASKNYDLTIGSGDFIGGFEDGLIGAQTGVTVTLNLKFPQDYQAEEFAGKDVVFTVTVNSIFTSVLPAYTDEFVSGVSEYKTIAEFEEGIRNDLKKYKEENSLVQIEEEVWAMIVEHTTVKSIPEVKLQAYLEEAYAFFKEEAIQNNMEYADYLIANFESEAKFEAYLRECAKEDLTDPLIVEAIAKAENISVSDEEYNESLMQNLQSMGYASDEEFKKDNDGYTFEEYYRLRESLLSDKVLDFVTDAAKLT